MPCLTPDAWEHARGALMAQECTHGMLIPSGLVLEVYNEDAALRDVYVTPATFLRQLCAPPVGHHTHERVILLACELHCRPCRATALQLHFSVSRTPRVKYGCHLFMAHLPLEAASACQTTTLKWLSSHLMVLTRAIYVWPLGPCMELELKLRSEIQAFSTQGTDDEAQAELMSRAA
jgi:hypothetical protein